jgi:hypothetical protein
MPAGGVYHGRMTAKLLPVALLALALAARPGAPVRNAESRPEVRAAAAHSGPAPVDFQTQILPILKARCQPCHFEGGKMYKALPFDRPETIHLLGEKMFTRIKDPKEQALLRDFLAANRSQ